LNCGSGIVKNRRKGGKKERGKGKKGKIELGHTAFLITRGSLRKYFLC